MKVKAVKVNRAHYFLTDPRTIFKFACKTVISSAIRAGPKRNQKDFL